MVLVANFTGWDFGFMAGAHWPRVGHLYSPGAQRSPWPAIPYALDNGAWAARERNIDWPEAPWRELLDWAAAKEDKPMWAIVPDVVGDRDRTLGRWATYESVVRGYGFRPAFALQDGMTFADVPDDKCMLFLGGTTAWKLAAIEPWCARYPGRVHVGRVSGPDRLRLCDHAGAVSVDGTGWRFDIQKHQLFDWLEETAQRRAA